MRHTSAWYAQLAARLDHPGFATLAEICQAETVESFRCPCCGDDVMGIKPVCRDCTDAGCQMTGDATGELDWWQCQQQDDEVQQ